MKNVDLNTIPKPTELSICFPLLLTFYFPPDGLEYCRRDSAICIFVTYFFFLWVHNLIEKSVCFFNTSKSVGS